MVERKTKKKQERAFNEEDVKVVRNLMAVRKKPSMYIGPLDEYGIFTVVREPADNVIDEFEAGRASELTIVIRKDGFFEVHDNGQGMPVGMHKEEKLPTLEVLVSILHAGGKLDASAAYKNSRGTHGVGVKATNALAAWFRVFTFRDGKWHTIGYEHGVKTVPFASGIKPKEIAEHVELIYKRGTVIVFKPDYPLFDPGAKLDIDMVKEWAETSAYLAAGFSITVTDEANPKNSMTYCFDGGIADWLEAEIEERDLGVLSKKPIEMHSGELDLVLTFTDADGCLLDPYCNGLYQNEGGNHLNGTLSALFASLKPYMTDRQKDKDKGITRDDIAEGLLGIVNFKADSPRFGGQTKNKLTDPRFEELCLPSIKELFKEYWSKNKGVAVAVCKRASDLRGAKQQFAVNKAALRELKDRAAGMGRIPGKLAMVKCKTEDREIFLVEGDSAGGTAKQARMNKPSRYQEILALKGKPLNAMKAKMDRVLASDEILNILMSLGFDGEAADPMAKLRAHKIIMLSDPDPDGYHINSLVLALLARVIPGVFDRGMIYGVVSPKYFLNANGQTFFAMTLPEMQAQMPKGISMDRVTYLKGWGEVNAQAMRSIAFDPTTRQLIKILPPSKKQMEAFEFLMGDGDGGESRKALLGIATAGA